MSSEKPTDPDLLKASELPNSKSAPFGFEGDADSLAEATARPALSESAVVDIEPPIPDDPTIADLFVEVRRLDKNTRQCILAQLGQVRSELQTATANIGDEYGERIRALEEDLRRMRLEKANGSTGYAG